MRKFVFVAYLLLSGAIGSAASGCLTALLVALFVAGPVALVGGWPLGLFGAFVGLKLGTVPAAVLGGLLWRLRVQRKWIWVGTGAAAGLGLFVFVRLFPGIDDMAGDLVSGQEGLLFALIYVLAGALAALVARVMMESLTAFDDAMSLDRVQLD